MKALACAALLALALPALAQDDPRDPWEPFNRSVDRFNQRLDETALKPLAQGYRDAVPQPVRTGVGNFFGNLGDVWSAVNHLLQGKVMGAARMTLRVASNTVFGLGGVLDPATEFGLERESEDLGQTLGRWGMGPGPYLVLPVLGPSSLRDAAGKPADIYATGVGAWGVEQPAAGVALGLELVDTRARYLGATDLLGGIALDPYTFTRDAYLSRRRSLVHDGDPPPEDSGWDEADDEGYAPPSEPDDAAPRAAPPASAASAAAPAASAASAAR